jgi:hypothetical protein
MMWKTPLSILGVVAAVAVLAGVIWLGLSYHWCPHGTSLQLTRKTGQPAGEQYAAEGQQGVLEQMGGPGRHFLNPWTFAVKRVDDVRIRPGQIGLVKSNIGKALPADRFIAGPGEKGTRKEVLTPGVWRINEFGRVVQTVPATIIEPGYVGVQTLREGPKKGILPDVLQAGYYNINPRQKRVDTVEIGYRVWEVHTKGRMVTVKDPDGGTRQVRRIEEGTGVSFPLADGKQMHLDFTVVWGIFPEDAPRIIQEYGTVAMVEQKIIEPQVLSICKNAGSNLTTQQFIEGATREQFQQAVTEALKEMGRRKGIHFLIALVRGFHPAEDIKATIQARMIAEEEKETLRIEQKRDTVAADLEQAQKMVEVAVKDFDAETEALVREEEERGRKKADQTKAEADRDVAALLKQAAETDAQTVKIVGQADADVIEARKKAEAKRLELLIQAYGGADPYNLATFAESLPADIEIEYRFAGPGTLWTEARSGLTDIAARKILDQATKKSAGPSEASPKPGKARRPSTQPAE